MSKYTVLELWDERHGKAEKVTDYAGRTMLKSACGNPRSSYEPTIDHIRPIADGGKDVKENIEICHYETNAEKSNCFPHWQTNGMRFHAKRKKGIPNGYTIIQE